MLVQLPTVIATLGLLTTSVHAYGMVAQVVDSQNFCVFLPPDDASDRIISDSEWNANAYCMGNTPLAKDAGKLPDGFITSAHYVKTDAYVQVTGTMDYTKANLVGTDEGGQMDIKAPKGSSCVGWQYYVNLIEPISNTYCMRCCNDTTNCNRGISEKGCAHIIPGDYSGPSSGGNSSSSTAATAASTTTISSSASASTASTVSMTSSSISSNAASVTSSSSAVISSSSAATSSSSIVAATTSHAPVATSSPSDSGVTEQSVSDGYIKKPALLAIVTGALISSIMLI
ncbi:hypothetical protein A0J61_04221 [Choanephora cucurbitarum]|uniref:Uncharacterized protein n=1 Tax=Choanephora cucurbitarum TaxID=101091 RepID=A0A1C7NF41_9FUNG|nr:hypothetical protein A0J61_04221 [Choanephora cucurbitarum]